MRFSQHGEGKKAQTSTATSRSFPPTFKLSFEKVRETIRHAAPEAKETISYLMPAFRQHGILVYFAAWKKHIGLYRVSSGFG